MSVLSLVERLIVLEDGHVVKDGAKDRVMESLNENVLKKKQTMHSVEEKQQEQGVKG